MQSTSSAAAALIAAMIASSACSQSEPTVTGRYTALDRLPDFGGDWEPVGQTVSPNAPNAPRLTPPLRSEAAAALVEQRRLSDEEGKPPAYRALCLPRGGHHFWNTVGEREIVMSPGQMFLWTGMGNESLRRVYIDGRGHSASPDPSHTGESVGTWEGDTLVVDTIAFQPTVMAFVQGDGGVPNGGGMHMVERFRLTDPDTLQVDVEITAPMVFTEPFKFTKLWSRVKPEGPVYEEEYVCSEADVDVVGEDGFQTLDTTPPTDIVLPPSNASN